MVKVGDFEFKNELLYGLENDQVIDYNSLVLNNAKIEVAESLKNKDEDEKLTERDYIISRMLFAFRNCKNYRVKDNYMFFLTQSPNVMDMSEVIGYDLSSYEFFKDEMMIPKEPFALFTIMNNCEIFATDENFESLSKYKDKSNYLTELLLKYDKLQNGKNILIWVDSKPTSLHIEKMILNTEICKKAVFLKMYLATRNDDKYSSKIGEFAKEYGFENLLENKSQDIGFYKK